VEEWRRHPGFDWAIIPDVIDGDEAANDALVTAWPFGMVVGVPVGISTNRWIGWAAWRPIGRAWRWGRRVSSGRRARRSGGAGCSKRWKRSATR